MSYIVIARKYRPSTFDDVVGQEAIVTTLKNAIQSNRVAHAYLFAGPRGVGKTSMARILSKALNCDTGTTCSPCNDCDICNSISNGNDVDVMEIDGASNRGIDEIRNIRQSVSYAPTRSRHKVYIIDEVHMLTKEAFNALLKTLEEPPSHVKFIFATTNADKLPETVQSRCQRFDFKNISLNDIKLQLEKICKEEKINAKDEVFQFIAKYARGGLRDALSLLDQLISFSDGEILLDDAHVMLGTIDEDDMFALSASIFKKDLKNSICNLEAILDKGKDVTELIDQIMWYLRDILMSLIYKDQSWTEKNLTPSQTELTTTYADLTVDTLTYMLQILSDVKKRVKEDRHRRVLLEIAIIKLATREELCSVDTLINKIESIENRLASLSKSNTQFIDNSVNTKPPDKTKREALPDTDTIDYNTTSKPDNNRREDETLSTNTNIKQDNSEKNSEDVSTGNNSIWDSLLAKIPSNKKSLSAILRETKLINVSDDEIVLELPKEYQFHKEHLEKPNEKKAIEKYAEEVVGRKVRLKLTLSDQSKTDTSIKKTEIDMPTIDISEQVVNIDKKKDPEMTKEDIINKDLPVTKEDIINKDCVKKAIEIFDGRIVDIRRIK